MTTERTSIFDISKELDRASMATYHNRLWKINRAICKAEEDFENCAEGLEAYMQGAGDRWLKVADMLSGLSREDSSKLKNLRPHAKFLAEYKLLTLNDKTPKPGDAFVDLVTCNGPAFVWSPSKPENFQKWKKNASPERELIYAQATDLLRKDIIGTLARFDPNMYLRAVETALIGGRS